MIHFVQVATLLLVACGLVFISHVAKEIIRATSLFPLIKTLVRFLITGTYAIGQQLGIIYWQKLKEPLRWVAIHLVALVIFSMLLCLDSARNILTKLVKITLSFFSQSDSVQSTVSYLNLDQAQASRSN